MVRLFLAVSCAASLPAAELADRAARFEKALAAADRCLRAWIKDADPQTLLLPDRVDGKARVYTPHNSGADLYPYLVLTSSISAPDLYRGRMLEMLRNEVRYTADASGMPGEFDFASRKILRHTLFGAGEYAKDGLITITELLGRTPWFDRMAAMTATALERSTIDSVFGKLPASDSELNGDYLQVLARLYPMTGDARFLEWGRRISDAYLLEVLPGNHGLPAMEWNFGSHTGDSKLKLRDHGNEIIVGLILWHGIESQIRGERAARDRQALRRMLDRVLESANPDGLLYNVIETATLKPVDTRLSDNWGYLYGAMLAYDEITGQSRYHPAVKRVLDTLPKYKAHPWEPSGNARDKSLGSFDGYADSIESAIYLVNRIDSPGARDWIESEFNRMLAMQRPNGHIENWYGEGNFNRTCLLYALMQSQGVLPERWQPGLRLGAVRQGPALLLSLGAAGVYRFDSPRHRRILNLEKNYPRLNEFPEWFTVDPNKLYTLKSSSTERLLLGSELIAGVPLSLGEWTLSPAAPH